MPCANEQAAPLQAAGRRGAPLPAGTAPHHTSQHKEAGQSRASREWHLCQGICRLQQQPLAALRKRAGAGRQRINGRVDVWCFVSCFQASLSCHLQPAALAARAAATQGLSVQALAAGGAGLHGRGMKS